MRISDLSDLHVSEATAYNLPVNRDDYHGGSKIVFDAELKPHKFFTTAEMALFAEELLLSPLRALQQAQSVCRCPDCGQPIFACNCRGRGRNREGI